MAMNFLHGGVDGVRIPNDASLTPASSKLTLSAWAKPNGGLTRMFISKNAGASPFSQYQLRGQKSGTDLKVRFTFQDNGNTTATLMNLGVWNHIVGTYDGTDLRVYFDGVFDSLVNSPGITMTDNGEDVGLGFNAFLSDLGMNGDLDDLRIYDRALSADEITTLFILRGQDSIRDGLISRWTFREKHPGAVLPADAGFVRDVGPSGNDGTRAGSPDYVEGVLAFGRKVA